MSSPFSFDPAFLAIMLLIPIGITIVVWIALRKYFETRQIGFLSIALAFVLTQAYLPITSLLRFADFRVTIWLYASGFVLFVVLIAYGLLKLSSKPKSGTDLTAGKKLSLKRQLSLLAGVAMIMAVFNPWIVYDYTFRTPTSGGGGGGSFFLFDSLLLPSRLELEQINISTLAIGAIFTGILLSVAGLGCIARDAKWSVLSVAGLTAFFFVYVGAPGANLFVATGSTSSDVTGWYMALSSGFILGIVGLAIGLASLIFSITHIIDLQKP